MSTIRDFRVLLIDDNEDVLKHLCAKMDLVINVDNFSTKIAVDTVHVKTEKVQDKDLYRIQEATVKEIATACSDLFDYILTDFAFVGDVNKNEELRKSLVADGRMPNAEDLKSATILQAHDIKARFDELYTSGAIDSSLAKQFKEKFLQHSGPITVYTNAPPPFASYFAANALDLRRYEFRGVFPNSTNQIKFLLMHDEFSISATDFDKLTPAERKSYYSLLLSRRIADEIKIKTLEEMVRLQHKLRIRNTRAAFRRLTVFGIGFGAFVALMGEVIFHLLGRTLTAGIEDLRFALQEQSWSHVLGHFLTRDDRLLVGFFALVGVFSISYWLFPKLGIAIAQRAEKEAEELLDSGRRQ